MVETSDIIIEGDRAWHGQGSPCDDFHEGAEGTIFSADLAVVSVTMDFMTACPDRAFQDGV